MGRRRAGRLGALAVLAALLAGCAGSGGGKDGKAKPTCKPPATTTVCFSGTIQPIFNKSCALAGCHSGTPSAQNLDLSSGQSYAAIVGVPSQQQPKFKEIEPGKPANSYLVKKIEGTPGISGVLMPQGCPGTPVNGAQCLTADDIAAISQWVTECAQNITPCP